ncbi:GNAT family N-acetyltransferase [Vibrio breoganii]|uniref:GNAT family N-acetyltransferase n=3 Tax=Vibrio TaxID=662 RepID=A0AAP8MXL9_9VIBR|nr:GNAT family N-acetyltransferase [Vibrio breoganii]NMO73662.1 GNAT family N-acetyltransferase [Vibrio breoganii]NMR70261.1 GNAT family N-acetyltransferase [Vibrio breoganii]PMF78712.1 GNAT family N-acetyltransferase [Vibrio breoganii]PMG33423.1 GNAT family N-acetyltransferase [Vibrio breoganii]PMG84414.1 GNAT family N-acetyltransferase [Vibrio breoganii]
MSIVVREGSLQEALKVMSSIQEFAKPEGIESLSQRLGDKKQLVLVAEEEGALLGFKIGYEQDSSTFYSWLGGVNSQARGKGVAQSLLVEQEHWVANEGYSWLTVKSRNQFSSMLRLLLRNGYWIEKCEPYPNPQENRLYFRKSMLTESSSTL